MKPKQPNSKKPLLPFISLFLSPGNQRMQDDSSIDWSADTPVTALSLPCVSPAEVYMQLSHVSLSQMGTSSNIRLEPSSSDTVLLSYGNS